MDGSNLSLEPKIMWQPKAIEKTKMEHLRKTVNDKFRVDLKNYHDLHKWSCEHHAEFWGLMWDFLGIKYSQKYMQVVSDIKMDNIPTWFIGARMNFAENLLKYRDDHLAIIATGEFGKEYKITYQELFNMVEKCASALKKAGLHVGDRVAAYIPNCVEAIVFMLAATSLGIIWSSTSPDFGATGVLDRFQQIRPKVLVSVNGVVYNGKTYEHISKVKAVVESLESLEKVVIINFVESLGFSDIPKDNAKWVTYDDFLKSGDGEKLVFEELPFNHPLYILYSSGTTGKPKCIVHSAGGTLIQHLKEHVIHGDMTRDDVFFQYTTTGWMMWNWLVSALAVGCTIVLFDGSPFKPDADILWQLAEKHGFTKFGTSAKYIQSLEEMKIHPIEKFKLEKLNEIYSTGSPLAGASYDFVYKNIKSDICLASITGGTDIVSLFAGHNHTLPVYRGEIQARCLGMAVESWVDMNKPVYGESGDLVCKKPFPCMPVSFWNDESKAKYREAYFSNYEHVWYHGDYLWINPNTFGVVMLGRSDGTLKPAGVRFGSAEIYNVVDKFNEFVADSIVVGQKRPEDNDERVVLFLKMKEGCEFNKDLVDKIKVKIRAELSPRHVPAVILPIAEIPYTINGKKVEVAVKKIVSGISVTPSATLVNPDCLKLYGNIPELK